MLPLAFETPEYTANSDALGTLRLLGSNKNLWFRKKYTKFYQASTSELYGLIRSLLKMKKLLFIQEVHMQ